MAQQEEIIERVAMDIDNSLHVATVRKAVDRAVELNRSIKAMAKELEELKARFREVAATGSFPKTETGSVELRSDMDNCATVCYSKDTPRVIKGADLGSLKEHLTRGQFSMMFEQVIVMRSVEDFENCFANLTKADQNRVKKCVAWTPNTPAVQLSK